MSFQRIPVQIDEEIAYYVDEPRAIAMSHAPNTKLVRRRKDSKITRLVVKSRELFAEDFQRHERINSNRLHFVEGLLTGEKGEENRIPVNLFQLRIDASLQWPEVAAKERANLYA